MYTGAGWGLGHYMYRYMYMYELVILCDMFVTCFLHATRIFVRDWHFKTHFNLRSVYLVAVRGNDACRNMHVLEIQPFWCSCRDRFKKCHSLK